MERGCSQCGECLDVCPVYREYKREEYAPKGKRILMEPLHPGFGGEYSVPPELSWEKVRHLARLCAGCGRCKLACARNLSTADLLADVRAAHPHWSQYLWELWIRRMGPLWPGIGLAASLLPDSLTPETLKSSLAPARALLNRDVFTPWVRLMPAAGAIAEAAPALNVVAEPASASGAVAGLAPEADAVAFPASGADEDAAPAPVVLFAGCTANRVRRQWRDKAEILLRRFGHTLLDASGFTCCGGSLHHAGQYKAMNEVRAENVAHWIRLGRPRIAVFCASCHHGLAAYADDCLDNGEAERWKSSLAPLSSLLPKVRAEIFENMPGQYGYHQPCHWGAGDGDGAFLAALLPGMVRGTGLCCGMGGILKMSNPELSMRMARSCLDGFPGNLETIVTGCSGCVLQLASVAPAGVTVCHWLDITA